MSVRNHTLPRALALLLALFLLGSCVEDRTASGPLVALVPEDALAALVIERPARLYAGLEAFWAGARLEESLGASLSGLIAGMGPAVAAIEPLLDTARPLAFAILPGAPGTGLSAVRPLAYLPFKGSEEAFRKALASQSQILALAKGYAVLSSAEGELEFPPSRPADLSSLKRYPAEALKLWASPALFEALKKKPGFSSISDGVRDFVTEGESEGQGESELAAFAKLGKELLAEIASLDAALIPSRAGLELRFGAGAHAGGPAEAFLAKAAAGPSALDWTSKVRADSLYAYSYALDPKLGAELGSAYLRFFTAAFKDSEELAGLGKSFESLELLQKKWAGATGSRGALDFNLELDAALLKELSGGDSAQAMALFEKAMKFHLDVSQEIKNEAAYRALLKSYASDPDLLAFMEEMAQSSGMRTGIKLEDKVLGNFAYTEMRLAFEILDASKFGGEAANLSSITEFMNKLLSLRYTIGQGRMVMTTEEASVLKTLSEQAQAPGNLAADPRFKAFAAGLPPSVQLVGSFSTRRLIALLAPFMPAGQGPSLDPERFGAWYSYLAARARAGGKAAGIETGLSIPASDIAAMIEYGAALKAQASAAAAQEL